MEITDEMMTRAFAAWSTAIANGEPGLRPALEAALPLIRGAVVEECAKVAEGSYYQECCGKGQYECCGDTIMAPEEPIAIAAAIRALSPREAGE